MVKHAITSFQELGKNCWLPARFCAGAECQRVQTCKYPEKATCEAVKTEIGRLTEKSKQVMLDAIEEIENMSQQIEELQELQKGGTIE